MIFFALLAMHAIRRYEETRGWPDLMAFWVASVMGLLSHLTFLHAYAAILVWSVYAGSTRAGRIREAIVMIVAAHAVPLCFLATLYLVYIRHLRVAGAEFARWPSVIAETSAVTLGIPARGWWLLLALLIVAGLLASGLRAIRRRDAGLFFLFITGIVVVPALSVMVQLRNVVLEPRFFARYFLVSITLFLLLMAWLAAEQWQRGAKRRTATVLAVSVYAMLNLWQIASFVSVGRGRYRDALDEIARRTTGSELRVSSNSDFRTSVLIDFYRRYLPSGKTVSLYPDSSALVAQADWRIVETLEPDAIVASEIDDGNGHRFRLMKHFPFYGLSGCAWSVYRAHGGIAPGCRRAALTVTAAVRSETALRWLDRLLLVELVALTFLLGCFLDKDTDIWWHLRAGREILAGAGIPRVDSGHFCRASR